MFCLVIAPGCTNIQLVSVAIHAINALFLPSLYSFMCKNGALDLLT